MIWLLFCIDEPWSLTCLPAVGEVYSNGRSRIQNFALRCNAMTLGPSDISVASLQAEALWDWAYFLEAYMLFEA